MIFSTVMLTIFFLAGIFYIIVFVKKYYCLYGVNITVIILFQKKKKIEKLIINKSNSEKKC